MTPFAGMLSQLMKVTGCPCDCMPRVRAPATIRPGRLRGAVGMGEVVDDVGMGRRRVSPVAGRWQ